MSGIQDVVNALSDKLTQVGGQLSKALGEVTLEIASLKAQVANGEPVDLSSLESKINSIAATAQSLDDVVPDAVSTLPTEVETVTEPVVPVEDSTSGSTGGTDEDIEINLTPKGEGDVAPEQGSLDV